MPLSPARGTIEGFSLRCVSDPSDAPCDAGRPAFVSSGVGRYASRRAGSFRWTFVIEHSLSTSGREIHLQGGSATLTAGIHAVNTGCGVVRSARASGATDGSRCGWMALYISIHGLSGCTSAGAACTIPVPRSRGILFDSKIKQLRGPLWIAGDGFRSITRLSALARGACVGRTACRSNGIWCAAPCDATLARPTSGSRLCFVTELGLLAYT